MDRSDVPVGRSAVAGVLAYLVGYLLTYLWQVNAVREAISGLNLLLGVLGGQRVPAWTVVGWLFYGAHVVPLRIPTPGSSDVVRSIVGGDGATSLLFVLPPLVLVLAGAVAAWWAGADAPEIGATAGASIAVSYLVLAVVGVFLFRFSIQSFVIGPDLLRSVVIAGIAYPVGFGAVGGAIFGATA